jgi:ribosomal-protein-alanine N-acetyltransferase
VGRGTEETGILHSKHEVRTTGVNHILSNRSVRNKGNAVVRMKEIRRAVGEDWEEFHKMNIEIFPEDAVWEDSFRKHVQGEGFFILELDDEMIGFLIVQRYGKDEGYVRGIGVLEAQRGKGYGRLLMDHALNWFRTQDDIRAVHLQADLNEAALSLYRKTGFKKVGTTWHYFVPFDSVEPRGEYSCHEIQESEIETVVNIFPSTPPEQIRKFLSDDDVHVLVLKNSDGNIKGFARFSPKFPGCFPFEMTSADCFDDFVSELKKYSLPEFDYVRTTFTNIPELAEICEKRKYRMHHKLYKMTLNLDELRDG